MADPVILQIEPSTLGARLTNSPGRPTSRGTCWWRRRFENFVALARLADRQDRGGDRRSGSGRVRDAKRSWTRSKLSSRRALADCMKLVWYRPRNPDLRGHRRLASPNDNPRRRAGRWSGAIRGRGATAHRFPHSGRPGHRRGHTGARRLRNALYSSRTVFIPERRDPGGSSWRAGLARQLLTGISECAPSSSSATATFA